MTESEWQEVAYTLAAFSVQEIVKRNISAGMSEVLAVRVAITMLNGVLYQLNVAPLDDGSGDNTRWTKYIDRAQGATLVAFMRDFERITGSNAAPIDPRLS